VIKSFLLLMIIVFSTARFIGDTVTVTCQYFERVVCTDVYTVDDSNGWITLQTKDNGKKVFQKSNIIAIEYPKVKEK